MCHVLDHALWLILIHAALVKLGALHHLLAYDPRIINWVLVGTGILIALRPLTNRWLNRVVEHGVEQLWQPFVRLTDIIGDVYWWCWNVGCAVDRYLSEDGRMQPERRISESLRVEATMLTGVLALLSFLEWIILGQQPVPPAWVAGVCTLMLIGITVCLVPALGELWRRAELEPSSVVRVNTIVLASVCGVLAFLFWAMLLTPTRPEIKPVDPVTLGQLACLVTIVWILSVIGSVRTRAWDLLDQS